MTMTTSVPTAPTPRLRRYQYRLRTLLLTMTFLGVFIGYAVNYGMGTAIAFTLFVTLAGIWFVRVARRWSSLPLRQRLYASIEGGIFLILLLGFIASVALNPSFVRERNARHLQRVRCRSTFHGHSGQVPGIEGQVLRIAGHIDTDRDLEALRTIITHYDWHREDRFSFYWNVTVASSGRQCEGWDEEAFGNKGDSHVSNNSLEVEKSLAEFAKHFPARAMRKSFVSCVATSPPIRWATKTRQRGLPNVFNG